MQKGCFRHVARSHSYHTVEKINHVKIPQEWTDLDDAIKAHYVAYGPSHTPKPMVEKMVREIESYLRLSYPTAELTVFGSYGNGSSTSQSDIDVNFRFTHSPHTPPVGVTAHQVLPAVDRLLKERGYVTTTVLNAKVPIVKVAVMAPFAATIDIVYYNEMGTRNTALLEAYNKWDDRMKPLFVWAKRWAKTANISGGTPGALSSFMISMMMVHYLQRTSPPVLPYLQDEFRRQNDAGPWVMGPKGQLVDTYFHTGLVEETNWRKRNHDSVGRLWTGFLEYFSQFEFYTQVVSVRTWEPTVGLRVGRYMNIEDPFTHGFNMTAILKKTMAVHIRKTFRHARMMTALPMVRRNLLKEECPRALFLSQFYARLLEVCIYGPAPDVSSCRMCHRDGHYVDQCPFTLADRILQQRAEMDMAYYQGPNGVQRRYYQPGDIRLSLAANLGMDAYWRPALQFAPSVQ